MLSLRLILGVVVASLLLSVETVAGPFVLFPKAGELLSPDGRYLVRNAEREGSAGEFAGAFRSLWLVEVGTGSSRKLCDYLGVASVGWSSNDFVVVTQYVAKNASRALLFSVTDAENMVMLDKATLLRLLPPEQRAALRENRHLFIEASRVEENTLHLTVWGYGQHDADGFRWNCEYGMRDGTVSCKEERSTK